MTHNHSFHFKSTLPRHTQVGSHAGDTIKRTPIGKLPIYDIAIQLAIILRTEIPKVSLKRLYTAELVYPTRGYPNTVSAFFCRPNGSCEIVHDKSERASRTNV